MLQRLSAQSHQVYCSKPVTQKYRLFAKQNTSQILLTRALKNVFKDQKLIYNARKESGLNTSIPIELDIYFPELNIAFEFQDDYHYFTTWYTQRTRDEMKERDARKRELAKEKGISLIQIPFWWDGTVDSLVASIWRERPDLAIEFKDKIKAEPIPLEPPEKVVQAYKKYSVIPGVGELTQATFYSSSLNPTGWMLFEKYDGIRAMWNHQEKKFFSRNGNELKLPLEIIDAMPTDISLDGEFWFGRKEFAESLKISSRSDFNNIKWDKFRYMVFDTPTQIDKMYKDRYEILQSKLPKEHSFLKLAPCERCEGQDHLASFSEKIMKEGAEGIILRNPNALYKQGKSKDYVKFKVYRDDEVKIIGRPGTDSWECELPNGIQFVCGADPSLLKEKEPQPGDIVTFKFTRYNPKDGKPHSPILYRYRDDVSWEDIKRNFQDPLRKRRKELEGSYSSGRIRRNVVATVPRGHWNDKSNRKQFFDDYAKIQGFDPKIPENWYNRSTGEMRNYKNGKSILNYYGNSLKRALSDVYPNVNWELDKFFNGKKDPGYWQNKDHVKRFLDEFAIDRGFDPTVPENWDRVTSIDIKSVKGGASLLYHYKYSLRDALNDTYATDRSVIFKPKKEKEVAFCFIPPY